MKNLNNVLGLKWIQLVSNIRRIAFFPPQADFITKQNNYEVTITIHVETNLNITDRIVTCTKLEVLMPKWTIP